MEDKIETKEQMIEKYLQDPHTWIRNELFGIYFTARTIELRLTVLELIIWLDDTEEEQRLPCGFDDLITGAYVDTRKLQTVVAERDAFKKQLDEAGKQIAEQSVACSTSTRSSSMSKACCSV